MGILITIIVTAIVCFIFFGALVTTGWVFAKWIDILDEWDDKRREKKKINRR